MDCEQLVVHKFPNGVVALAAEADLRCLPPRRSTALARFWQRLKLLLGHQPNGSEATPEILVPPGTYLILKSIPGSLRQRYGLEEDEGVVFVPQSNGPGRAAGLLQCNNGAQIRLKDLRELQRLEVLSMALAGPAFADYYAEPQVR